MKDFRRSISLKLTVIELSRRPRTIVVFRINANASRMPYRSKLLHRSGNSRSAHLKNERMLFRMASETVKQFEFG